VSHESHSRSAPTATAVEAGSPQVPAVLDHAWRSLVPDGPRDVPARPRAAEALTPAEPQTAGAHTAGPQTAGAQTAAPLVGDLPRSADVARVERRPARHTGRHILFVAWRDLANPRAGGSEVLVDRLADGMTARGDRVTLLCGGRTAARQYEVIRSGGSYTQFLRAPLAYQRRLRDCDLVVEVCNGMPFFAPLWSRRPMVCLVNHVHTELWGVRFPAPLAAVGRFTENVLMPRAHRKNLFLTISPSTEAALTEMGVDQGRIRQICNGVESPQPLTPRSPEPMFLALGRLTDYKRIDLLLRLWERVRQVVGGQLVIAGDGPERARIEALAGPGVVVTGRVSEEEKHRLLCSAWMLLHPAMIEGWGIVIAEAAIRGTPGIGFDVPGLRDSVIDGQTGLLVRNEGQFASAWASLALDHRTREALGRAARERALRLHWSAAVDGFAQVADEAMARGGDAGRRR
jgi:glycosyltransferase involved in cell wall biosynthesis